MSARRQDAIRQLGELVAYPTVSAYSNMALIEHVQGYLARHGIESHLSFDGTGEKANIFATIGPERDGGVVLCGHTDVVPVEGQEWSADPFLMEERDGRLFGRGTVDMKGFIACALAMVPEFLTAGLELPVHLAFTFDEEVGCCGAPVLVDQVRKLPYRPRIAIVGEPTEMRVIAGHKGGYEMVTTITGLEGHASMPGRGASAISAAARFIAHLEALGEEFAAAADPGSPFDPPGTTISIGTIHGGTARNIIAGHCRLEWEMRPVSEDDAARALAKVDAFTREELLPAMRRSAPDADIFTEVEASYPGLAYQADSDAIRLVRALTGANNTEFVPFGTDAGHLQRAGMACVVFGPGSINQAHKPDEYIEVSQMDACLGFLDKLRDWLSADDARRAAI